MAIKIASKGFAGGDPAAVMRMPVDWAFEIADFIRYQSDYEETRYVLNNRVNK